MKTLTVICYIVYFFIKYYLFKKWMDHKQHKSKYVILFKGLGEVLIIYFVCERFIVNDLNFIDVNLRLLLNWLLLLLIIFKPVNINFRIFFDKYNPYGFKNESKTIEGAGALIGNLERLLVAILMFYGQYSSVGLVFTAKSITRFERISKEPSFAEYYLIGSLYSIICVLIIYGVIMKDIV